MRYATPIWPALAFAGILVLQTAAETAPEVRIAEGPALLHANMDQQWGGHTFSYLLEGEQCLFWSATQYNPDGKTWGSLIGQYPKPGSGAVPAVMAIPAAGIRRLNLPALHPWTGLATSPPLDVRARVC